MSKEEILRASTGFSDGVMIPAICRAMQTYADQETTLLHTRIAQLESENEQVKEALDVAINHISTMRSL